MQKINESKNLFCEKINKIDKLLSRLIKKTKKEDPNKVRNVRQGITTDTKEM